MSIRFESFAGDTSTFAVKVSFLADPDDGHAIDADVASSWGALQIWVQGANVTAHSSAGETSERVHWYLLPFLEWLVSIWNPLLHEEKLPCRIADDDAARSVARTAFPPTALDDPAAGRWEHDWQEWWKRHALQACRDGGLFPDLFIRRWRDEVEVSWGDTKHAWAPSGFRFLAPSGVARFQPMIVAAPLYKVLANACEHLLEKRPGSERLVKLRDDMRRIESTNQAATRLAWLAGLGRSRDAVLEGWDRVVTAVKQVGSRAAQQLVEADGSALLVIDGACHGSLLFGSVAPDLHREDVVKLAGAMAGAFEATPKRRALDDHVTSQPVEVDARAWEQAYELAEDFRARLGLADGSTPDVEEVLRKLDVALGEIELSDQSLRAVALAGPNIRPTILLNTKKELPKARRRFTLAHELCHLLVDSDRGARLALVNGPWVPKDVERRANAFAAAFLMPQPMVARLVRNLTGEVATLEGVVAVARETKTSITATIERLHDLGYIDDAKQECLKDELVFSDS